MNDDRNIIAQFMWGYQPNFRISVRVEAEYAFKEIGFSVRPVVFLVGFRVAGDHPFDICIEPERGPYSPNDLANVLSEADRLYQEDPESRMSHSVREAHDRAHNALRDKARAQAVATALENHQSGVGHAFFGSYSTRVGDYDVHVLLGIPTDALAAIPRINTTQRDRQTIVPSLVHALIEQILYRAHTAMYLPDAGAGLRVLGVSASELVRAAAERLMQSALNCAGLIFTQNTDRIVNAISALPYEGREGFGSIVVAESETDAIEVVLRLVTPVSLREGGAIRKLMEAGGRSADLLAAEFDMDAKVYGLGRVLPSYDESSETIFRISVLGRGAWDLGHGSTLLLSMRDGIPQLPGNVLDIAKLRDVLSRLFRQPDLNAIEGIAQAMAMNDHGAMLVVSEDASAEAQRLSPQAWRVMPTQLAPPILEQLTAMDGAILVDPQGLCHAIGVILDGQAAGRGDPARGSRYHNSLRYLDTTTSPTVIVVYSADGHVDVLPKLRPRVARVVVAKAVKRYVEAVDADSVDLETISSARRRVEDFDFYLSVDQCDAVNAAAKRLEEWRAHRQNLRVIERTLAANPEMNDSYWL